MAHPGVQSSFLGEGMTKHLAHPSSPLENMCLDVGPVLDSVAYVIVVLGTRAARVVTCPLLLFSCFYRVSLVTEMYLVWYRCTEISVTFLLFLRTAPLSPAAMERSGHCPSTWPCVFYVV